MLFFDGLKRINIIIWNLIILVLEVVLVSRSIITIGDIVIFNLLFNNILVPLQNIHHFIDEVHEASLKTNDLKDIFNLPVDISYFTSSTRKQHQIQQYALVISHIFSFDDKEVLKDITYNFEKGKYYGIIGSTGCGKSTLLRIIMNLINADSGELYIFGTYIIDISRQELSSGIIFMPQTPYIFSGTIRDNMLFSTKNECDDSKI